MPLFPMVDPAEHFHDEHSGSKDKKQPDEEEEEEEETVVVQSAEPKTKGSKGSSKVASSGASIVDAPAMLAMPPTTVRRRSDTRPAKHFEAPCLGVACVEQRRRSRSSRTFANRTADVRATCSRVRPGTAKIAVGIG